MSDQLSLASTCRRTFFSLLDENEVDCIARMLSSNPNEKWKYYLDLEAVELLVSLNEMLSGVARRFFKSYLFDDRGLIPGFVPIGEPLLIDRKLAMLNKFGPFVEKLSILSMDERAALQMVAAFTKYGSSLKQLNIFFEAENEPRTVLHELLELRGNQLESLEIVLNDNSFINCDFLTFTCIAEHCTNLKELSLTCMERKMPILFWQRVGANLRKLSFQCHSVHISDVIEIRTHCRGLIEIDLPLFAQDPEDYAVAITELLQSYGEQLEKASVYILPPENYTEITAACPNVKMKIEAEVAPDNLAAHRALGANLSTITLVDRDGMLPDPDDVSHLISACPSISTVYLTWSDIYDVYCTRAILSAPMYNVKMLELSYSYTTASYDSETLKETWTEILNMIANNFQELESLSIYGLNVAQGTLKRIADRNGKLDILHILLQDDSDLSSAAVDVLNSFTTCTRLSDFHVNCCRRDPYVETVDYSNFDWSSIATACLTYRRRGLYVKLFDRIIM